MQPDTSETNNNAIRVIGLGYVGLPLAVTLGGLGFRVHGVERRPEIISALREGAPHINEPGLTAMLRRVLAQGRLVLSENSSDGPEAAIQIITVGTPLGADGRADFSMITRVSAELAEILRPHDLVILRSTVRIGVTRNIVKPTLDQANVPYDLAFCPERIIEGKAMAELRTLPQIVGALSKHGQLRASQLFHQLTPTVVRVSSVEVAEMVKLVDNTQRDVLFGYANEIARVCDQVGICASEVIRSANLGYPRSHLASPGPVGGPCLSKDPYILDEIAVETGAALDVIRAARRANEQQPEHVTSFIAGWFAAKNQESDGKRIVAMLGLAFKGSPATDDVRGTMVVPILDRLKRIFPHIEARGFDSEVEPDIAAQIGFTHYADGLAACAGADLVILANRHPAVDALDVVDIATAMTRPGLIYDLWSRHQESPALPPGIVYCGLGSHCRSIGGDE